MTIGKVTSQYVRQKCSRKIVVKSAQGQVSRRPKSRRRNRWRSGQNIHQNEALDCAIVRNVISQYEAKRQSQDPSVGVEGW
jgi:predicted transcriptional regulator